MQNTEYRVQSTEFRVQSTEYRVQNVIPLFPATDYLQEEEDVPEEPHMLRPGQRRDGRGEELGGHHQVRRPLQWIVGHILRNYKWKRMNEHVAVKVEGILLDKYLAIWFYYYFSF